MFAEDFCPARVDFGDGPYPAERLSSNDHIEGVVVTLDIVLNNRQYGLIWTRALCPEWYVAFDVGEQVTDVRFSVRWFLRISSQLEQGKRVTFVPKKPTECEGRRVGVSWRTDAIRFIPPSKTSYFFKNARTVHVSEGLSLNVPVFR